MKGERVFGLDLVRAIAILSVVFFHSIPLLSPLISLPYGFGWALGKFIAISSPLGLLGVEIFFVLSGFLIGSILIRDFANKEEFNLKYIKSFWIKRWSRTLPNYYFILAINVILYVIFGDNKFDWRFLTFCQNLISPHPNFFPEAWSLSVEEWFYLTLPVALFIIAKALKANSKKRTLFISILCYLLIFVCIRTINAFHPYFDNLGQDSGIRKVVILRLDGIAYGVMIAFLNYFYALQLKTDRIKKLMLIFGIALTTIIILFYYLGNHPSFNFYNNSYLFKFLSDSFLFSVIPLSLSLTLPFAIYLKPLSNKYSYFANFITQISLISYSMYLIHFSIVLPIFQKITTNSVWMSFVIYCSYWITIIILSTAIFRLFEKPSTDFLRKTIQ